MFLITPQNLKNNVFHEISTFEQFETKLKKTKIFLDLKNSTIFLSAVGKQIIEQLCVLY